LSRRQPPPAPPAPHTYAVTEVTPGGTAHCCTLPEYANVFVVGAAAAFECTLATRLSRTHSARLALCSPSLATAHARGGMRAGACGAHVLIYGAAAGAAVARCLHIRADEHGSMDANRTHV
jgi:hypothetical protein